MTDALSKYSHRRTPQSEKVREDQVKNSAGGYTFQASDLTKLHRFLTLGTEGGTYYVTERELTRKNAEFIVGLAKTSRPALINEAVKISLEGRAPRNNAALFAIAAASALGDDGYRAMAYDVLPQVARTGTHLLQFAGYREQFGGWGPGTTKAVGRWFTSKDPEAAAYQLLKYQQRNGWSQRDLLRLSHMGRTSLSPVQRALFAYVMKGEMLPELAALPLVEAVRRAHRAESAGDIVRIIESTKGISWEMLPSECLARPEVWRALFESGNLPLGALLRNLARMTTNGALTWNDHFTALVAARLADPQALAKARIHPVAVLMALKTYVGGRGLRGKGSWNPVAAITDALNDAFYESFRYVEPTGKRILVALDVSGSMGSLAPGTPLTCREVTAAMAMTQLRTEPNTAVVGFTSGSGGYRSWNEPAAVTPLGISSRQRLDDVTAAIARLPFGGTDCALPMVWALQQKLAVDTFQVWTDSETWAGKIHPHQALREYREKMGIDARLQVVGIASTDFSIADPTDPGQLDVAGFDAAIPALLANHGRGLV